MKTGIRQTARSIKRLSNDTTEHRRAEEAIARLAVIVESSGDAVTGSTPEGIITDWNEGATQLYGYTAQEAVGQPVGILAPTEEEAAEMRALGDTLFAGDGVQRFKARRRHKSGRLVTVSLTLSPIVQGGKIIGISAISRDITEAEQMQEALRASEERYRLLFERNLAGVFCASSEGEILECNDAYWRMLGLNSRAEALAHNLRDLCVEPQEHDAACRTLMQRGQLVGHETRLRRPDGKIVTLLLTATLVSGKPGGPPLVQGTSLDVTEIRHLQQAFLQSQKMEAVGRLAGGVAHDFNNLLMVISSYSELLLESLTQERQRRHAEQIQKAALRASDLTGQLLAFSRKQTTVPRVLNLNAVVRDIEKMLLRLIGEDIRLEAELDEALVPCRVDLTQVQQVILNLVVNARDAMPQGGRLLIETANVELDEAYCTSHPEVAPGPYVMLAISDTGIGMDSETRAHLFEPFFTTKEVGKGTGLGLSTVYGIVKQNGGSVSVYSELGHGASFKVYLPGLVGARTESSPEPAATGPAAAGSGTILLVEDEPALREAAVEHLRSLGYEVLDVADGEQALRVAQEFPRAIDLLLTDVIMPGLGGTELGHQVQRLRPEIRVLYMSGYTENAALQDPATKLPGHFLQKPFSFRVLGEAVMELLKVPSTTRCSPAETAFGYPTS